MLLAVTLLINYIALGLSIWLGIYVITQSSSKMLSWLTGLTLFSFSGMFLNILFALNPPHIVANSPNWIIYIFPFWRADLIGSDPKYWLDGWSIIPAVTIWHHATMLFRPGKLGWWRIFRIAVGYLIAIGAVIAQSNSKLLISSNENPLFISAIRPGENYNIYLFSLMLFIILSLINLYRNSNLAKSQFHRRHLKSLLSATLIAGLTGPILIIGTGFGANIPIYFLTIFLLYAIINIGSAVAQYSALSVGRIIRRDFFYNAISVGAITLIYMFVTFIAIQIFDISESIYTFVLVLSIISHSFVDIARKNLDTIFYNQETRNIRNNLTRISKMAGEENNNSYLEISLDELCSSVKATFGVLLSLKNERIEVLAKFSYKENIEIKKYDDLLSDDVRYFEQNHDDAPLDKVKALIPLYWEEAQIGAIILGRPVNSEAYSDQEIDRVLYAVDQLSLVLHRNLKDSDYITQIVKMEQEVDSPNVELDEVISIKRVEEALRKMSDYGYLGNHDLRILSLVKFRLTDSARTHLDYGRALNNVLGEAVEKLKPQRDIPEIPLPREWYPYMVLNFAYIEEMPNRDIMARLNISEGTFNRTRRAAVRSVTQALSEMEYSERY